MKVEILTEYVCPRRVISKVVSGQSRFQLSKPQIFKGLLIRKRLAASLITGHNM